MSKNMVANIGKKRRLGFEWFVVSKKKIYRLVVLTIILLFVLGGGYGLKRYFEATRGNMPDHPSARFLKVDGRVTVRHSQTGTTLAATQGTALAPGDTIQTSSDSSAVVEYVDGSVYNIKPGSTIIFNEEDTVNNQTRVAHKIEVGQVSVKTQEQSGTHTLSLPNTTAKVDKGSTATFNTNGEADSIVVNEGKVDATTPRGREVILPNQRIEVTKNETRRTELPPPPKIAGPQNAVRFLLPKENSEIQFTWEPVPSADHYRLMISPVPTFQEQALTIDRDGIGDTKYKWLRPIEGGFYWRVQAITKDGVEGNWSDAPSFIVKFKGTGEVPLRVTKITEIHFLLVEVEGVTKPGVNLTINEKPTTVDAKGAFKAEITFPRETRERTLAIEAVDINGNSKKLIQRF